MCKSSFDIIKRVVWLLQGVVVIVFLVVVIEVDEVGIVVVVSLSLRAVMGKMFLLPALEASVVSCAMGWFLSIGYISSGRVSSPSAPPIVWGSGSVKVHWDWLVIHPSWGIGRVVLGLLLSLSSPSLSKLLSAIPSSFSVLREE